MIYEYESSLDYHMRHNENPPFTFGDIDRIGIPKKGHIDFAVFPCKICIAADPNNLWWTHEAKYARHVTYDKKTCQCSDCLSWTTKPDNIKWVLEEAGRLGSMMGKARHDHIVKVYMENKNQEETTGDENR